MMRNSSITFFILIFCICGFESLFSQKLNFSDYEKITFELKNKKYKTRLYAVQKAIRSKNEQMMILIKEHLLRERHSKVIQLILAKLELRKSRRDFFYLLDFLKQSINLKLAYRTLRLLRKIHLPRLQRELKKMFKHQHWKIHFVNYIIAINDIKKSDRKWVTFILKKFNFSKYFIILPLEMEKKLLQKLVRYHAIKIWNKKQIEEYYYLVLLENERFKKITPKLKKSLTLERLKKIPSSRVKNFLDIWIRSFPVDTLDLAKSHNKLAHIWVLKKIKQKALEKIAIVKKQELEMLALQKKQEGKSSKEKIKAITTKEMVKSKIKPHKVIKLKNGKKAVKTKIKEKIRFENIKNLVKAFDYIMKKSSLSAHTVISYNLKSFPNHYQKKYTKHCLIVMENERSKLKKLICARGLFNMGNTDWFEKQSLRLKVYIAIHFYRKIMQDFPNIIKTQVLRKLLGDLNYKVRLKTFSYSSTSFILKYKSVFEMYFVTEKKSLCYSVFLSRIYSEKPLKNVFLH